MTAFFKRIIILVLCICFVSACTPSKKEAAQGSEKAITNVFKSKQKPKNAEATHFTYYKPSNLKISQKGEHNLIFKDQDKNVYILFVNPKENEKSELNYKTARLEKKQNDILKSFHVGDTLLYISIRPIKDKKVELIVDAGGVKMTTQTSLDQVKENAKMMAQVIQSVKIIKDNKKS